MAEKKTGWIKPGAANHPKKAAGETKRDGGEDTKDAGGAGKKRHGGMYD